MSADLTGRVGSLSADAASREPEVRWKTAALLEEIPGEESEAILLSLLKDPDYRVRERAVSALVGRLTERGAAECLAALGDEADAGHRAAALSLLARSGPRGMKVLSDALRHASADVRLAAAMNLPPRETAKESVALLEEALLREEDPNVRGALLGALGRTRRREAVAAILPVLEHGNVWLKVHAIEALGEIGDPDTAGLLLSLSSEPRLRRAALRALARLRSPAPAEELALLGSQEGADGELLAALRSALEAGEAEALPLVRRAWPLALAALIGVLRSEDASPQVRSDAAHLMILMDLAGSPLEVVRSGPFADAYDALLHLTADRLVEALHAILQVEDPEPALVIVQRAMELGQKALLVPLLVHPSPAVRAAVLNAIPPGAAHLSDLIDILAEEDAETALPAALALAATTPEMSPDRRETQKKALLDRASGSDGPGRIASLLALADVPGEDVDEAIGRALSSPEPGVRTAAARAAGSRRLLPEDRLAACLDDSDPAVRSAALRAFARWGEEGRSPISLTWKDCLVFLADEGPVAAAAGAAIIALAGEERARMAEELLAQGEAIRIAALEEIPRTGDAAAAAGVALAIGHEDVETARAALLALSIAGRETAESAAATSLADPRPAVRRAAAELVAFRGAPSSFTGPLARALALALASERDPSVLEPLLEAVAVAGGEASIEPLTELLSNERTPPGAAAAAVALAERFEAAAKRCWQGAPARAERHWARALSAAAARRPQAVGPEAEA